MVNTSNGNEDPTMTEVVAVDLVDGLQTRKELPHSSVYCRLGVSSIHGIGVFAICDIQKGTSLFPQSTGEARMMVSEDVVAKLSEEEKKLYEDFTSLKDGHHICPVNFNLMNVSWYLNHSQEPNTVLIDGDFFTMKAVKAGEELLFDYRTTDGR